MRVAADLVLGAVGEVDGVERFADPAGGAAAVERGGVSYTVVGSVPPVAAENAARGL